MGEVVHFPAGAQNKPGFERVKSVYTVREISRQFGISPRYLKLWTQEGIIPAADGSTDDEILYDFRALSRFRQVRELRSRGLTIKQIDAELHGQMNLFPEPLGTVVSLPSQLSAFEEALLLHERADKRAAHYYQKAIEEGDYAEDALCNLGILEFEAGNIAKAFDCFTRALKTDPRHFEAHFNLGYVYFEAGDQKLARVHYEMAAEIEPSCADVYFNLGVVDAMSGDLVSAVAVLSKAKDLASEEKEAPADDLLESIQKALRQQENVRGSKQALPRSLAVDAALSKPTSRNK